MIYCCYLVVGTFALFLAGMNWFDAVNHSFCAISTGGFSTHPESIGYWDSAVIEAVTIALMLLGSLNFVPAYLLWHGRFAAVRRDSEVRLVAVFVPLVAALLLLFVCRTLYPTLGKSVRVAIFETVTCMTTTCYATVTYSNWNAFGILMLIAFMIVGGGTGSTGPSLFTYH
jgi:trk system potassium uptake protein TrkH